MSKVFYVRDIHPDEKDLVLTDMQLDPPALLATVTGHFGIDGNHLTTTLSFTRKDHTDPIWHEEFRELLRHLRSPYANEMLFSAKRMQDFCNNLSCGPHFVVEGKPVFGFETHSNDMFYYIACMPNEEDVNKSVFTVRCYSRACLIHHGLVSNKREEV